MYAEGNGFIDGITSVINNAINFAKNNPELVKSSIGAVSSIGNATANINKAVESSNRLKELHAIQKLNENKRKKISDATKIKIAALANNGGNEKMVTKGSGFQKF